MARTLVHWYEGDSAGKFFLIPSELVTNYRDCKGYYINAEPNDELKNQKVEHLAWMLGVEPHDGEIPKLEKHLADNTHKLNEPPKTLEEKEEWANKSLAMGDEDYEERKKKLGKGPLSGYEITGKEYIHPVDELLSVGWYC